MTKESRLESERVLGLSDKDDAGEKDEQPLPGATREFSTVYR
jgi:hypothetical protein